MLRTVTHHSLAWFAALVFVLAAPGAAQEYRGMVTGVVMDSTDAVVPGVKLTLTNAATNASFSAISTNTGAYYFQALEPGTYKLRAEKTGFKPVTSQDLVVRTGSQVGFNLHMDIGDLTQTIAVTAEAPLLNTTNVDSGQVIDQTKLQDLPMNGRSPYILARLAPGVVVAGMINETQPYDSGGNSFISIGGTRRYNTEMSMNGVPNVAPKGYFSGYLAYTPPAEATQEFKVVTNAFDSQYGRSGSALISVSTKSGTNQFHGALSEYLQNDKLRGTNFFVNRTSGKKPPLRSNQFGGAIGGPVTIPKVFNGKDRAFFFFSYEGIRNAQPGAAYATLPTMAMRGGDFSELLRQRNVLVFDPMSLAQNDKGETVRAPYAGNIIPTNRLSPIAVNMLKYLPQPNVGGPTQLESNYFSSNGSVNNYNNYLGRFDLTTSEKNRMFISLGRYLNQRTSADLFKTLASGGTSDSPKLTTAFDDTYAWSPTLILNFRLGYTGSNSEDYQKSAGMDLASLGFPNSFVRQIVDSSFPRIDIAGYTSFGANQRATSGTHTYFAAANATKITGSHSIRFGFEGRESRLHEWQRGFSQSNFKFNGKYTAGPALLAGAAFGQSMAGFLVGLPDAGSLDLQESFMFRGLYTAYYVQDDWKITPNLTMNAGLRYDFERPPTERFGRTVTGWTDAVSPIEGAAKAAYSANPDTALAPDKFRVRGGVIFPGQSGTPWAYWEQDFGRIQPRLGLAYNPSWLGRRLVFRAGAGVSYFSMTPPNGWWALGYSRSTPFVATVDNGLNYIAGLSDPFPSGLLYPRGNKDGVLTNLGDMGVIYNRNPEPTRANKWMFSIQAQVSKSDVVEINYTGANNNHTPAAVPMNYTFYEYLSKSPVRDQAAINWLQQPVKNPFLGLIPAATALGKATITRQQLLYDYPQYTQNYYVYDNCGSINFQSMYISWERRYVSGMTVLANYTISKQLHAQGFLNRTDTYLSNKRHGNEDRPQQFTASVTYDLPFGKGKPWLAGSVIGSKIAGGWKLGGIYFKQSGGVIQFGGNMVFNGKSWGEIAQVPSGRNIDQWFNTALFERSASKLPDVNYQYRYFPQTMGVVRSPGANQFDFSLIKDTSIRETATIQFRAEFFNALNHPTFGDPNTSPTSAQFGQITWQANQPRAIQLGLRLSF